MKLATANEYKYLVILFSTLLAIYSLLFALLVKYYKLAILHILGFCKIPITDLFSSKVHIYGFITLGLISVSCGLFILKFVFSAIKTQRKLKKLIKVKSKRGFKVLKSIVESTELEDSQIIVAKNKKMIAFTFGLIRPKILISTSMITNLSKKELEAVLLHEHRHVKNLHVLWLLFTEVTKSLLFFVPIVDTFGKKIKLIFEIKADEAVISKQGTNKHLRSALVKAINPTSYVGLNLYFAASSWEQRVKSLFNKNTHSPFGKYEIFSSTFVILFLVGLFLVPPRGHRHGLGARTDTQYSCEDDKVSLPTISVIKTAYK